MIWFLVIAIIALVILAFIWDGFWEDFIGGAVVLSLIVLGVGWFVFQLIGNHNTYTAQSNGNAVVVWERETDLRALTTNSSALRGETFLTVGYVDGDRVYSYIYETPDGGIIVATKSLGSGMVYEVDGLEQPYMREVRSRGSWWWTWTARAERTEFYVPTGSVRDSGYDVSIEQEVSP